MANGTSSSAVLDNIAVTRRLFESGLPPSVLATVSGSDAAQRFWQQRLERAGQHFRAQHVLSLHEDLPVNQAFGILLLWQRLRPSYRPGGGALAALVFGEGSRATPFTETDNGQKPAIATFAAVTRGGETSDPSQRRYWSMVELALRYFAPVESYLRRSGFDGVVIKWGDEVQIPSICLSGTNPLFQDADVVRFVSLRQMTPNDAANKDWVGVDQDGRVTSFIPRRPIEEMAPLADRGLIQRRDGQLWGGVNLGSIALSRHLLDELLAEFSTEVNDPSARRSDRPDLDPQLFTALTIASISDAEARHAAWNQAQMESSAIRQINEKLPSLLPRLRRVFDAFEQKHQRQVRMVALDFGEPYWGDVGQHPAIYDFFMALNETSERGEVARALAGIDGVRDENGNWRVGQVRVQQTVTVTNSVLIDCDLRGTGLVRNSVLVGTQAEDIHSERAFDVQSVARGLKLAPRAGSYQVVSADPIEAKTGERITSLFLPDRVALFRVNELTDLRDRVRFYESRVPDNPLSFAEAHRQMLASDPLEVQKRREAEVKRICRLFRKP